MGADTDVASVRVALQGISESLDSDGYRLGVESAGDPLVLTVALARPDACDECLVPKELMIEMVRAELAAARVAVGRVELRYPVEH